MSRIDIFLETVALSKILYKTCTGLKAAMSSGNDIGTAVNLVEETVQTIAANLSSVLDDQKKAAFLPCADQLQKACAALKKSGAAVDQFWNCYHDWEHSCITCLYVEAMNAANACEKREEPHAVELLELIAADQPEPVVKSWADFFLCHKLNVLKPMEAYEKGRESFELNPAVCGSISLVSAPYHNYVYHKTDEVNFDSCPVCHGSGTPFYCAMPLYAVNYSDTFSPVKLWMKCDSCGQLYSYNFPKMLTQPQPEEEELGDEAYMQPKPFQLPLFGNILKQVIVCSKGKRLLEVGAGTGELIAAALEFGCEVEAIEISKRQARRLTELLGIDVHCMDFLNFSTSQKFNIVTMGDVIEHVTNPSAALEKAHELLEDDGILWISTPNFESGFSRIMKYNDPMWNEPYHITYFSYSGFEKLLREKGFEILGYSISQRYNGSMEITARRQ